MSVSPMTYWSISSITLEKEAKKLGLEIDIVFGEKNLFYIKGNNKKILFKSTDFGGNSSLGLKISDDKELTYKILNRINLPIAKTWYINKNQIDKLKSLDIDFPVIIKPLEEGHGNGVIMNILNQKELKEKLEKSFEAYGKMIIQKQIEGDEYRILVLKGEVILAINRVPAFIIGDNENTIEKLIEIENTNNPLRGEGYNFPLSFIKVNSELIEYISKNRYNLNYIPKIGEKIQLLGNSNIGTGGIPIDVTNKISKNIKEIACLGSKELGLEISGVDIITNDITKPLKETGGIILEINSTPGIGGHKELTSVNTGKVILEKLFFNK